MRALMGLFTMFLCIFGWFVAINFGLVSENFLKIIYGIDIIVFIFIPVLFFANHRDYVAEKRHNLKKYFERGL